MCVLKVFVILIRVQRDERDTELAQWYLNKVKDVLQGDTEKYEQFLQLLVEVDRAGKSPVTVS